MTKEEVLEVLNARIRGIPVSFEEKILPLIGEFLTDINCEKSDLMMTLIVQQPQLTRIALPTVMEHMERKYGICKLLFNNKIIKYYE